MSVVAKFVVAHVDSYASNSNVHMHPVCPPADDSKVTSAEDGAFWQATPSGKIELMVNNPAAAEQFQPGDTFYVTFERAK